MIVRTRNNGGVNISLNEFMKEKYPQAMEMAQEICFYMSEQLELELDELEIGYLAVHIYRYLAE